MGGVGKPLRLKDLLELDCESCSAAGFRCYPRRLCAAAAAAPSPMRHLAEAEAARFGRPPSLRRPRLSHLSRSLSRRLRGGFWRRREEDESEPEAKSGSPVAAAVSGCGSDSETASESGSSTERKSESDFSSAGSESLHLHAGVAAAAAAAASGAVHEAMKRELPKESGSGSETDDKEQLSPVAVMDFPFDDGDDDVGYDDIDEDVVEEEGRDAGSTCSPSFSESLAQLQRRKKQLQHKIQRFGSSGELGPENLEARFAASNSGSLGDVDPVQLQCCTGAAAPPRPNGHRSVSVHAEADECILLELLITDTVPAGVDVDDVSGRLLLDFFVETTSRSESTGPHSHAPPGRAQSEAVRLAKAWLEGAGSRWGLTDVLRRREDFVAEMERSRRWTLAAVAGEESEVGAVMAGVVVDELVDELVRDLAV